VVEAAAGQHGVRAHELSCDSGIRWTAGPVSGSRRHPLLAATSSLRFARLGVTPPLLFRRAETGSDRCGRSSGHGCRDLSGRPGISAGPDADVAADAATLRAFGASGAERRSTPSCMSPEHLGIVDRRCDPRCLGLRRGWSQAAHRTKLTFTTTQPATVRRTRPITRPRAMFARFIDPGACVQSLARQGVNTASISRTLRARSSGSSRSIAS